MHTCTTITLMLCSNLETDVHNVLYMHVAKLVTQITYKETNSYCILCLSPFYNYLQAMIGNRKAKEKWEANVPLCWVPPSPKSPLYVDSDIMYTHAV